MASITAEEIFEELLSASEAAHLAASLLVDVDSTLFHVHTRNQATFESFLAETPLGRAARQSEPALSALEFSPTDWGWKEPLLRAGLKLSPETHQAMERHWQAHFFSGRFLHKDIEFSGARSFLERLLRETGVRIYYLTARDELRMGPETRHDWAQRRWPLGDRAKLWLKPRPEILDAEFKADVCRKLRATEQGPIYLIDNEPTILEAARPFLPTESLVLMDSVHSGKTPLRPEWRVLTSWD